MNRNMGVLVLLFTLIALVLVGCGSGGTPTAPNVDATVAARVQAANVESTVEARVQAMLAANGQPSTLPPVQASTEIPSLVTPTATPEVSSAQPAAELDAGSKQVSDKDGMTLLYVPAGEFTMGSNEGTQPDESSGMPIIGDMWGNPEHIVYLDAFWIDQTEVTNAMYANCVKAGVCQALPSFYPEGPNVDNYPVVFVPWSEAKQYCEWAGRSLPTEAQWEKAARGTDGRLYPWGNQPPDKTRLNYVVGDMTQVGAYPAGVSPYGALDMAGNAPEWVADWYGEKYYASSPDHNPVGPSSGDARVIRSVRWNSKIPLRIYIRSWARPDVGAVSGSDTFGSGAFGFRCAR